MGGGCIEGTAGVGAQFEEGLVEGVLDGVIQLAEGELGAGETVDGEGGEAEDAQGKGGLAEGLGLAGELHDAAGLDAQHGDFVVEAGIPAFFEVFEVSGLELVGVEAVFEGVVVAAGCAATEAS